MSLRVGVANPRLAALHKANNIVTSSFITAVNPFSKTLPDDTNAKRQALLVEELKQRNLVFIGGIGLHSSGKWPGEPSFLALGLDLHSAKMLGAKFEQNAVVWIGNNAVPQLILLR
jgi:hypothetical protein